MLTRRLIVCLDVKGGRVMKGIKFQGMRDVGDPVALAAHYERQGADEITFLDISATNEERAPLYQLAQTTAESLFIPLTIGGGIRTADDVAAALRAGADKVSMNSAAVKTPELLTECARRFGAQCVVVAIDAKREGNSWRVYTHAGRTATGLDAVAWASECVRLGAGEILLTSIDQDGTRQGYDLALTRAVSEAVQVPVIASGGAGGPEHIRDAFLEAGADAALVAGIVHDGHTTVRQIKAALSEAKIPLRA